jgi:DNA repair protein RAD50
MSSIDKLIVSGVRAFSPHEQQMIEFYRPLTILVGHNGAGKTTIIECLRYACTGEFPPSTGKGKSFVHDPSVAAQATVKAKVSWGCLGFVFAFSLVFSLRSEKNLLTPARTQVQLKLSARNGKPVVVTRGMSATQTRTSVTFKTEASSLATVGADGERVSFNRRCADLNDEVPSLMGVSRSILECVVFCHQEESNWPLADPATLKKKFDDIFASTRYTKALDAMKKEHKDLKAKTQVLEQTKLTHEERLKQVRDAQKQYDDLKRKCTQLDERLEQHERAISRSDARAVEMKQRRAAMRNELAELEGMRYKFEELQERYTEQSGLLADDFSSATIEELEKELRTFNKSVKDQQVQVRRCADRLAELNAAARTEQSKYEAIHARCAGLESDLSHATRERKLRDDVVVGIIKLVSTLSAALPPSAPKDGYDDRMVDQLLAQMREHHKELEADRRERQREEAAEMAELDAIVSRATATLATERERQKAAQRLAKELEEEQRSLQGQLEEHRADFAMRDSLQQTLASREADLARVKAELEGFREEALADVENKRREYDAEANDLKKTLTLLSAQAHLHAELELKQKELEAERSASSAVVTKEAGNVCSFFNSTREAAQKLGVKIDLLDEHSSVDDVAVSWAADPPATSETLSRCAEKLDEWRGATEKRLQRSQKQETNAEGEVKRRTAERKQCASELEESRARVAEVLGTEDFTVAKEAAEAALAKKREDSSLADAALSLYDAFLDKSGRERACPLCKRDFEGIQALSSFSDKLKRVIAKLPDKVDRLRNETAELEGQLKRIFSVQSAWERSRELSKRLPEAEGLLAAALQEQRKFAKQVEAESALVQSLRAAAAQSHGLVSSVRSTVESRKKVSSLESRVADLVTELGGGSAGRSVADVQAALEEKERQARKCLEELDDLRLTRDKLRDAVHENQSLVHEANKELLRVQELNEKIQQIDERIADAKEKEAKSRRESTAAREKVASAEEDAKNAKAERAECAQRHTEVAEVFKSDEEKISQNIARLDSAHLKEGKSPGDRIRQATQLLEDRKAELESVQKTQKQLKTEQQAASHAHRAATDETALRDVKRRNIEDALRVRKLEGDVKSLKIKISEKETSLRDKGIETASDQVTEELDHVEATLMQQRSDRDRAKGERQSIAEQMSRLKRVDLARSGQRQADYEEAVIDLHTTNVAAADLERYRQALDRALMRFHSEKIAEINRIIKELWQVTYQSSDIDAIMVKADDGTPARARPKAAAPTSTTRKSYNYRLVMLKGGAELDMRGRCSAGQKVLASLIVRLALAETFCTNCGILTLDEPTTNLDRANIGAFAGALTQLIEQRHRQSNFQLVIITHDEEFVQMLGRSEHADFYWRVSKNDQQHSMITKHEIADI